MRAVPILIFAVVVGGAAYQAISNYAEARRSPEAGRAVDIGGRKLWLNCSGASGPVVILESGLGDASGEWRLVQPEIAKQRRVCSYDRAGYGGSDPGPMPRTSVAIANDLHTLLQNAGERAGVYSAKRGTGEIGRRARGFAAGGVDGGSSDGATGGGRWSA